MDRAGFLYEDFLRNLEYEPTGCQKDFFSTAARFVTSDDADILVLNGYAGTGKTTALSAVISSLSSMHVPCVLMAPTGRAAKVLSRYSGRGAATIHKCIYRQKSVGDNGFGQFSIAPNKARDTLFIVDEVSLITVESMQQQSGMLFGTGNLLEDLVSFVRSGSDCRLILVGDSAQLPPIGLDASPALSKEYMEGFGGVMFATMTTVVRQASQSGILHNATLIRNLIASSTGNDTFDDVRLEIAGFSDVERIGGGDLIETLSDAYDRFGEDDTVVLCRSNKRAIRYNMGIRGTVQYKEERLVKGDKLMIVKNCYQFVEDVAELDYIANGDIAKLEWIGGYSDRYGLHFADARLLFPDYGDVEIKAKVCLDTLESEAAALTYDQQNMLFQGVTEDYAHIASKRKRYEAVREDHFYNALQLKYANAITCHKSQGGQWKCVFIDCPFWQDEQTLDDLKWLYTALTRAVEKVYLVNFNDRFFV